MLGKEIKDFDPANLEFTFSFTKDLILDKKITDKHLRSLSRCQRIYFGIRDKTFRVLPPQIVRCECGHYICIDGQHRICVAQNKNLKLDVHMFKEVDGDCEKCMPIPIKENTEMMTINGIKFNIITGGCYGKNTKKQGEKNSIFRENR